MSQGERRRTCRLPGHGRNLRRPPSSPLSVPHSGVSSLLMTPPNLSQDNDSPLLPNEDPQGPTRTGLVPGLGTQCAVLWHVLLYPKFSSPQAAKPLSVLKALQGVGKGFLRLSEHSESSMENQCSRHFLSTWDAWSLPQDALHSTQEDTEAFSPAPSVYTRGGWAHQSSRCPQMRNAAPQSCALQAWPGTSPEQVET